MIVCTLAFTLNVKHLDISFYLEVCNINKIHYYYYYDVLKKQNTSYQKETRQDLKPTLSFWYFS